jgi:hypothetical protein
MPRPGARDFTNKPVRKGSPTEELDILIEIGGLISVAQCTRIEIDAIAFKRDGGFRELVTVTEGVIPCYT